MRNAGGAVIVCLVVLFGFQFGCAGATAGQAAGSTASGMELVSLSPSAVATGQSGFSLVVTGAHFSSQSVIEWNGSPLATAFVNSGELTAQIPSAAVAQASVVPVAVKNTQSGQTSNALSLTIAAPPKISTTSLPAGNAGAPYSATLSVSGGIAPFHWSTASGNLPAGLALSSQTGTISGTAAESGDSMVGVVVTDSLNTSAQANVSIDINSETQASSSSGTPSSYYGSGIGADSLGNTVVGGPYENMASYRFLAMHSGAVQQFLIYLIPNHVNYAAGTGGTIQVTVHTDDGTASHNPSSTVLATYIMSNVLSLPSPALNFYTVKFPTPLTLTAGQLYHMVFKNIDASPTVNYLSVDDLRESNYSGPVQGGISTTNAAVLLSQEGGAWEPRLGYTPIYQITFQNGVTEGVGYMEVWPNAPEPISGTNAVRETFTVSGASRTVSSVAVKVARVTGDEPLVVRLENANGTLIEEGSIPAANITMSTSSTSPSYYWTSYTFATPYTLVPGDTYHLDFEASSTATYDIFPIRKGLAYGFQNTTYFPDGYAEFEQNHSWNGWTQWGVTDRTDGDLQFYFSVVP